LLQQELAQVEDQIRVWKEKAAIEEQNERNRAKMLHLAQQDTVEKKQQLDWAQEPQRREQQASGARERESRPAYWPLLRDGMSKEEKARWFDDHLL
jgi:hypothetical protein